MAEPVEFGRYLLVERLGRGGMAEAWRGTLTGPEGFRRELVVKRLLSGGAFDPELQQRFLAEARLCARLHHPNIVQVFELGEVDGEFYLTMEYLRGRTVIELLRRLRPGQLLPIGFGAAVVRDVCAALAYAHELRDEDGRPLGIVHRDVTPANVMVTDDGLVKLLDFGIARTLDNAAGPRTRPGVVLGTEGYLAPERISGAEADARADIFAAGVLLHEILSGRRLFRVALDDTGQALAAVGRVDPPSQRNPAVTPGLDAICMRALAADPNARFASAAEMQAALSMEVERAGFGMAQLAAIVRGAELSAASSGSLPRNAAPRSRMGAFVAAALSIGAAALMLVMLPRDEPKVVSAPATAPPPPAPLPIEAPVDLAPQGPPPAVDVDVVVASHPAGAHLHVDGVDRGRAPQALKLVRGTHRIEAALPGYAELSQELTIDVAGRYELRLHRRAPKRSSTAPPPASLHDGLPLDPYRVY